MILSGLSLSRMVVGNDSMQGDVLPEVVQLFVVVIGGLLGHLCYFLLNILSFFVVFWLHHVHCVETLVCSWLSSKWPSCRRPVGGREGPCHPRRTRACDWEDRPIEVPRVGTA